MSKNGELEDFDNLGAEIPKENNSEESTEKTEEKKTFTEEEVEALLAQARIESEKKKEDIETVQSSDDVTKLLAELISNQNKLLMSQNQVPDSEKYSEEGYVDTAYIDPEDELEEPIEFFTHSIGYVIVDDSRNGFAIPNPYRKKNITFKHRFAKRKGHGKEQNIEHFSTYICNSKKEAEWLRNHSYFNIKFFDDISRTKHVGHEEARMFAHYFNMVEDYDANQVRKQSRERGLVVYKELREQKVALAVSLAQERISADDESNKNRVIDAIKDAYVENN